MVYVLRKLVSKKKKRHSDALTGINLDMAYITPQIIAMGYPSESVEAIYRNPKELIKKFFDAHHKEHYMFWNLCAEPKRQYNKNFFYKRIEDKYQFYDHEAPKWEIVIPCCKSIQEYLKQDKTNVAVIHCKAGKGRTGVMISAYLLYNRDKQTAQKALDFYAVQRTYNNKGVTIPSQRRYIFYLDEAIQNNDNPPYPGQELTLTQIKIGPVLGQRQYTLEVLDGDFNVLYQYNKSNSSLPATDDNGMVTFDIKDGVKVKNDTKILFLKKKKNKYSKKFGAWVNTQFVHNNQVILQKHEIDKVYTDKKHKRYGANFSMTINFTGGSTEKPKKSTSTTIEEKPSSLIKENGVKIEEVKDEEVKDEDQKEGGKKNSEEQTEEKSEEKVVAIETKVETIKEVKKEDIKEEVKEEEEDDTIVIGEPTKNDKGLFELNLDAPSHIHRFIVGKGGSVIKSITSECGNNTRINLDGDKANITSQDSASCKLAAEKVAEILNEHKDAVGDNSPSKLFPLPKNLQKYALGEGGSALKKIAADTKSKIEFEGDNVKIQSNKEQNIAKAHELILAQLETCSWYFKAEDGTFYEETLQDRLFGPLQKAVEEEYKKMEECYAASKKAFGDGDGAKAKELSAQGKVHKEKAEQLQEEASRKMFEEMNKKHDEHTIDLHGLQVSFALKFTEEAIESHTKKGEKELNIITGAGNHSGKDGPKIKPAIEKMLSEKKLSFEAKNNGTFAVKLS